MEKVIVYSKFFEEIINELIDVLYEKEYFGFKESSKLYTEKIYDYIFENIEFPISKKSPPSFKKYGQKYLKYKANQRTIWYIFFDQKDHKFLVNYILNNHSRDFPELI